MNWIETKFRYKFHFPRMLFPISVLVLYLLIWSVNPEKTWVALRSSLGILYHVVPSLCLVFLLMVGLNLFLKPLYFADALKKGSSVRQTLLAALAGIVSAGPIYAWYPMLKDLREKGAKYSLIAVFLVNRAVKPFLLPMLVSLFGWSYTLMLTLLTVAGSFCVGFVVGALLDGPNGSVRRAAGHARIRAYLDRMSQKE